MFFYSQEKLFVSQSHDKAFSVFPWKAHFKGKISVEKHSCNMYTGVIHLARNWQESEGCERHFFLAFFKSFLLINRIMHTLSENFLRRGKSCQPLSQVDGPRKTTFLSVKVSVSVLFHVNFCLPHKHLLILFNP